ncbi:MAG: CPBP family intramembrane metalloprotease [Anaerolineaceae bacterium]|nr:CPBP family intramembrane metalloprotease [Anaerolineaceae bacterium]
MNQTIFPQRHPYGASGLLFVAAIIIFLVSGTVVALLELPAASLYFIAFVLLGVVCVSLLTKNGWWREVGFRPPYERRLLWLFWLPFVPVIGNLLDGLSVTDPRQILLFFLMAVLSGFVEETLFRGLILRALRPRHLAGGADLRRSLWRDAYSQCAVDFQPGLRAAASGLRCGHWFCLRRIGHSYRHYLAFNSGPFPD